MKPALGSGLNGGIGPLWERTSLWTRTNISNSATLSEWFEVTNVIKRMKGDKMKTPCSSCGHNVLIPRRPRYASCRIEPVEQLPGKASGKPGSL
jgi:hypothetical protein